MIFELQDVPFPPSVNQAYAVTRRGKICRSESYSGYVLTFHRWAADQRPLLRKIAIAVKDSYLRFDYIFYYRSTLNDDGSVKRVDLSNRIKVIEDQIARVLGIDDSYVFVITAVKKPTESSRPHVTVKIRALAKE